MTFELIFISLKLVQGLFVLPDFAWKAKKEKFLLKTLTPEEMLKRAIKYERSKQLILAYQKGLVIPEE